MEHDIGWKEYFSDDARYADIINGLGCGGRQVVKEHDLQELDTQAGICSDLRREQKTNEKRKRKSRDIVRKAAFGVNFAVIGIENQELIDYSMPLRCMLYDAGEYEKQTTKIRKTVRQNHDGLTGGEYLYGFRKDNRLYPTVTFILYCGAETWDGPRSLHEILNFKAIPEELRKMVSDYRINLIEIRKLEDTSVFRTDVRHVFNFIRCSEDKKALRELVEREPYYRTMEEHAFCVAVQYTNAVELALAVDHFKKGGKVDMCTAIKELIADGRTEGIKVGRAEGMDKKTRSIVANMIRRGMEDADIRALAECGQELIDEVRRTFH